MGNSNHSTYGLAVSWSRKGGIDSLFLAPSCEHLASNSAVMGKDGPGSSAPGGGRTLGSLGFLVLSYRFSELGAREACSPAQNCLQAVEFN